MTDLLTDEKIIQTARNWVETLVVGLNLCPFARRELINNRVRFVVTHARSEAALVDALDDELRRLQRDESIETTLLIHPDMLKDFYDYNDFLAVADGLLIDMELDGVFQVASFHPHYQFADTQFDDVENYTNRSPFPMLHLLREDSLEKVIDSYPDIDTIPERNVALLREMGRDKIVALLEKCWEEREVE